MKLCDFGVSGTLIQSVAQTFMGTTCYMAVRFDFLDNVFNEFLLGCHWHVDKHWVAESVYNG